MSMLCNIRLRIYGYHYSVNSVNSLEIFALTIYSLVANNNHSQLDI